jgi:hypothetical protein
MAEPNQPSTLISLASSREFNAASRLTASCKSLDPARLVDAYDELVQTAPKRHLADKRYFVGHTGVPSTGKWTNRREEHLAIALWNDTPHWQLPNGSALDLLDYQVPLKARQSDRGVGKIDLFAIDDSNRPVVAELKILGKNHADTPLRALLEALAYAAIVEANGDAFRSEIQELLGRRTTRERPDLLVAAPNDYWMMWDGREAAAGWFEAFSSLCAGVSARLGCVITLGGIGSPELQLGLEATRPRLITPPKFTVRGRWDAQESSE